MPDGTIAYFVASISRKLTLIMPKLDKEDEALIDEILETDLPELIALVKKAKVDE